MTKNFQKICRLAGAAIADYRMIREDDRILIGVSGGKDSMLLLHLLHYFQAKAPIRFQLAAATFDPGFEGFDAEGTAEVCRTLKIISSDFRSGRSLNGQEQLINHVLSVPVCAGENSTGSPGNWGAGNLLSDSIWMTLLSLF